ncbi:ATP-dependent DNA helicase [Xanthomonas translucens]|uniref:ATP-dependent DNA helicase n=1 Tax=Xanthomonas campestris pv. translucens TaxID=343 RepID=UPI00071E9D65|nr:ATP-dependent DNA helicase [Xanthomonas translucens]KTF39370.1 helicase [Xanthomonas translucens pv. translucens]KWV12671.1 helicase [Xanthomonas translucens]MCS3361747.1 ATP-dependent DNA helicase [Xanthomonas translucens pv. translucens]MCS3375371.1 ATP-dependent DNA helicase [Xanthomonas translucens pv. translucens]MCT8276395.1 ATP-dependent DNA helicase [Xanthomonas translucens pv. translucens]
MSLAHASTEALSEGGALARQLDAFVPRAAQLRLTAAIAEAFEQRDVLLAEAGTGTGKTYAYLVPALLSGLKTIVSTGTRALQDQLYHRDLPRVRAALGVGLNSALLKGRANYLCKYRLEQAKGEPRFTAREQIAQFQRIVAWGGRTRFGDIAELDALPDDSPLLPMVTSTMDNCLGTECPFWGECFVVQARQRAQAADVVVVNHHLLLADLALKQEGFGEILPGAQVFVIDEAHQLPELAANFFGESFGMRPLQELARDCLAESRHVAGALASLQAPVQALEQALRELRAAMEGLPTRGTQWRLLAKPQVRDGFDALLAQLTRLQDSLAALREASPGFDACAARAQDLRARLGHWLGDDAPIADFDAEPAPPSNDVLWYELSARGFRCQRTPLDVSGPLRLHRETSHAAWVFTSATLAVKGDFEHIATRLGLSDPMTLLQPSPFDWARQALCYLPTLPDPNARGFGTALIAALHPVLQASQGRAFLLFASHRALREAAEALRDGPWPLFVQGEAPRARLLQRFRESGNGVLLGSASFREGVDVVGDALSVVVIDKLPFAAPDDPVFEARLDAIRRDGGNPFRDEQLPQAVIALKQGVGRLIRSETDRGVLVLCDPRLLSKSYGRTFLESLPPFARTRDVEDVRAFFASGLGTGDSGLEASGLGTGDSGLEEAGAH